MSERRVVRKSVIIGVYFGFTTFSQFPRTQSLQNHDYKQHFPSPLSALYDMSALRFRTWPITATSTILPQLQSMGLRLSAEDIDGTTANSSSKPTISEALVSVGSTGRGGTGSFISDTGLIITNWHVAHEAVRVASLKDEKDYLRDGFSANTQSEEIKSPYECWITTSCVDVSDKVLAVIKAEPDPLKRANAIRDCTQSIASSAQQDAEGVRCDVQEMLPNESYVLFTQTRLQDVRIVYSPPKSLGNFGGDTDNFEWPRRVTT